MQARWKAIPLAGLLLLGDAGAVPTKSADNPKPAGGDISLPMPGGGEMVFRPVFLDVGDSVYAGREFKVGDRSAGGFREYPTVMVLGGSFLEQNKGRMDWMYYLGKYEVTERQYHAVMTPGSENDKTEPISSIGWFDAQDFIHRYNLWLMRESPTSLPRLDDRPGFLRLPTEAEWEFAARGGAAVSESAFDRKHPYGRNLVKHEWFSGPKSSHDKIKKIGILDPNALGLHDMLGNVSEMTDDGYRIEYYQGRTGGMTVRGGNFRTPESQVRSSMRSEIELYRADGSPGAQSETGFRLAIASPVFAGPQLANDLSAQWEEYRKTRPVLGTAAQSTAPTAARTSYSLDDALRSLERIETGLKAASLSEDTVAALGLLKASFGDVAAIIAQSERDSAAAWARMASYNAWFLRGEQKKVPASERVLEISRQTGSTADLSLYEQRHQNLLANIRDSTAQYALIMKELGKLTADRVREGFRLYEQYLIELGLAEQIKINGKVREQYEEFERTKRLNMEEWVEQIGLL